MSRGDRRAAATTVAAAQEVLAREVDRLVSGEDWQRFLRLQSRLHGYSFGNLLLIEAAHRAAFQEGRVAVPEPSMVAGFRTWQSLGRHVVRGQRGYPILAPLLVRSRPDTTAPGDSAAPGTEVEPASGPTVVGFRVVHVFDVSQTDGVELPAPPAPLLLVGAAPVGLLERVAGLIEGEGFAVGSAPDAEALGGANGVTDWTARRVLVRADMDDAARAKTLLHEAGHVLLHGNEPGRGLSRPLKEVEAESVAFVAGSACGLRSDVYSFPYVAAWAGTDPAAVLAAVASRVASAAERVLPEVADIAAPAGASVTRPVGPSRASAPVPGPVVDATLEGVGL